MGYNPEDKVFRGSDDDSPAAENSHRLSTGPMLPVSEIRGMAGMGHKRDIGLFLIEFVDDPEAIEG